MGYHSISSSSLYNSCLQVDLLPEPGVQVDLQLRHLVSDVSQLFLDFVRVLLDSGRCGGKHLLCLFEWQVEE